MQRPTNRKSTTDEYPSIRIGDLTKHQEFKNRASTPRVAFHLGGRLVRLVHHRIEHDWYVEIIDYCKGWSRNTINLIQTPGRYGGERQWFECPQCSARIGIVFYDENDIGCRKCLGLGYFTQRMNYRSLSHTFYRFMKAEKLDERRNRRTYRGKPTRYAKRHRKLTSQIHEGVRVHRSEIDAQSRA